MKKSVYCITLSFLLLAEASCKSTKLTMKASGQAETVVLGNDRLAKSLSVDSLFRSITLSADSVIVVFASSFSLPTLHSPEVVEDSENKDDMYLPVSVIKPKSAKAQPHSTHGNALRPSSINVYGLHIDAAEGGKSVVQSSVEDSTLNIRQSLDTKDTRIEKSEPSHAPKWLFWLVALVAVALLVYYFRTFLFSTFRRLLSSILGRWLQ